jgi:hypothetical protein
LVPFLSSNTICLQSAGHFLAGLWVLLANILEHQCIANGDILCHTEILEGGHQKETPLS